MRKRRVNGPVESEAAAERLNHKEAGKTHHHPHQSHHAKHSKKPRWFQTKKVVFLFGALLGLLLAGYTAQTNDIVSMDALTELGMDRWIEELKDYLPNSIVREAKDFGKEQAALSESFAVGKALREEGLHAKYPVVLIPGVISTGLESWSLVGDEECPTQPNFRKRLWGSWHMLRSMLLDKNCWLKHVKLDPLTGLDPPGFKLRAAQGMEAADFFVAGYWIWNKILENLSALGYDPNLMNVASYDWRLAYPDLERRDGYFSKLKRTIEQNRVLTGEKSVLVGHSMGSQVIFYFLKWVEAEGYGNGGRSWVNDHVKAFVDISGSMLGTPKTLVALLSGEMKDTVQLNALAVYGLEKFFSRRERADMLRTFGGITSILPKGGDAIWGSLDSAPDDLDTNDVSFGNFIRFRDSKSELSGRNLTVEGALEYLYSQTPEWFRERTEMAYSHGLAKTRAEVEANEQDPSKWTNPLEAALPNAPDLEIYCFYGVGNPTERSYYYQEEVLKDITSLNVTISQNEPTPVVMGEGDGTVSLLTHTMCHRWQDANSKFNPGGSKITVVEMLHQPDKFDIRGGAKTAEHVDILGRTELNELVLRVAAGNGSSIEDHIFSDLKEYVHDLDLGTD